MKSIRETITEKSNLLRDVDSLGPVEASKELVELSSLLSSLNREIVEAHYWLNVKRVELLKEYGTAAKARIYSEGIPEWKDWMDRVVQREAVEEMIRAVKYYLKSADTERREGKY